MSEHRHTFTALWYHFGPYGDQTVHNQCFEEGCDRVLIGDGRDCGEGANHRRMWLTENGPVRTRPRAGGAEPTDPAAGGEG